MRGDACGMWEPLFPIPTVALCCVWNIPLTALPDRKSSLLAVERPVSSRVNKLNNLQNAKTVVINHTEDLKQIFLMS